MSRLKQRGEMSFRGENDQDGLPVLTPWKMAWCRVLCSPPGEAAEAAAIIAGPPILFIGGSNSLFSSLLFKY